MKLKYEDVKDLKFTRSFKLLLIGGVIKDILIIVLVILGIIKLIGG